MTDEQKNQIIEAAARKRAEMDRQRWPDVPEWDEMSETMRRFRLDDAAMYAEAFGVFEYVDVILEAKKDFATQSPADYKYVGLWVEGRIMELAERLEGKEAPPCATASK